MNRNPPLDLALLGKKGVVMLGDVTEEKLILPSIYYLVINTIGKPLGFYNYDDLVMHFWICSTCSDSAIFGV